VVFILAPALVLLAIVVEEEVAVEVRVGWSKSEVVGEHNNLSGEKEVLDV
jgi:hypothetical protein